MDPVFMDNIIDVRGREVARSGGEIAIGGERYGRLPGGAGQRALPAAIAYELTDMLREVVRKGTARAANKPGLDRAGKTGTTNGFVDAWFIGFTPRYTAGVWIGTDGTNTLGDKETGGRAALPAWMKIMEHLPHVTGERFPIPDESTIVHDVSGDWVALARGSVPSTSLNSGTVDESPLIAFDVPPPFLAIPTTTAAAAIAEARGEDPPTDSNEKTPGVAQSTGENAQVVPKQDESAH